MSSTPCSKAASLVLRSPRRVNARTGVRVAPPVARAGHLLQEQAAADVHVDDGQVGLPLPEHRGRLGDVLRLARDVDPVVERELDHLDDQRLVDHDQDARGSARGCHLHLLTSPPGLCWSRRSGTGAIVTGPPTLHAAYCCYESWEHHGQAEQPTGLRRPTSRR